MATTSPDNLYSPDATAAYNIPVDTAAMQSSVQTALNGFSFRKGTTTQMNAYLATAVNGEYWLNTTDNRPYQKISGAWVSQDTGWIQVTTFQNSFSASTDSPVFYRRLAGVTYLRGDLKRASAPGGIAAFNIPAGYRPGSVVRLAGRTDVGMGFIASTNGDVLIAATAPQAPGGGSGYALAGYSWIADN